ncbi:MAG TPA: sugar phosphotransferase [Stenotrophomonas sp.]|nr:sugar phosphotransferase [Stenotrophomonas sp.]
MQHMRGWSAVMCLALAGCAMSVAPPAAQDGPKQDPAAAAAATPGVVLPDTEALRVHDPAGRDYPIWVALPADYAAHPEKRYPVLYVTDALYSFPLVRSVRNLVGQKGVNLEDFILVGLPPQEGLTSKQSRSRDYTPTDPQRDDPTDYSDDVSYGGAAHYRDLLAEQVLPMIDARYRTDPARRAFAGHSYGGLFGAYVLNTRPDLFSTYILSSPSLWFDHHQVTQRADVAKVPVQPVTVVLSAGSFEAIKPGPRYFTRNDMVRDNAAFAEQLRRRSPGIKVENMVIDGEDHFTVYPEMITRALLQVWPGEGPYSSG